MITPEARTKLEARYSVLQQLEIPLRTAARIVIELNLPSAQDRIEEALNICLTQQIYARAALDS